MNELMDAMDSIQPDFEMDSVQPDFEMANEWMEELCRERGVEFCEDLTRGELKKELIKVTVMYENERVWNVPGNEQLVATLLSYKDWLDDLILDIDMDRKQTEDVNEEA